jgi:alkylmercury lyase
LVVDGLDLGPGGELALDPGVVTALRRAGFSAIRGGEPVTMGELATLAGVGRKDAIVVAAALVERGTATVDGRGRLDGIAGLTLRPSRHGIEKDGERLHTWCAFDAVGIPAALGWTAAAVTHCGHCGAELRVSLETGVPAVAPERWGWLPPAECEHVLRDFCIAADLYCSRQHLDAWQVGAGDPPGRAVPLQELAETGRQAWADCAGNPAPDDGNGS